MFDGYKCKLAFPAKATDFGLLFLDDAFLKKFIAMQKI